MHAAAHVHIGWTGQELHRAINVEGTKHVVAGASEVGARLVHVSTVDTLGLGKRKQLADEETPPNLHMRCPYIVTKQAAEQVVLDAVERGLDAVIVNPTYMIGPWDWKPSSGRMLLHIARGRQLLAPRGGNDFCDVRDVAAGIHAAANRGQRGRRYILGGEPMSYLAAWKLFAQVAGVRGPICRSGPINIMIAGWAGDVWRLVTGHEPDLNSASTKLSAQHHHFSYRRAADELGYAPRPRAKPCKPLGTGSASMATARCDPRWPKVHKRRCRPIAVDARASVDARGYSLPAQCAILAIAMKSWRTC